MHLYSYYIAGARYAGSSRITLMGRFPRMVRYIRNNKSIYPRELSVRIDTARITTFDVINSVIK